MPRKKSMYAKKIEGTYRPDRQKPVVVPESETLKNLPRIPADLSPDARRIWKKLGRILITRHTLSAGDLESLTRAAEACATAQRLSAEAADARTFVEGASGQTVINPIFGAAKGWSAEARSWLNALGLSPVSRPGIEPIKENLLKGSEWEKI